jgi:hypothetical protein
MGASSSTPCNPELKNAYDAFCRARNAWNADPDLNELRVAFKVASVTYEQVALRVTEEISTELFASNVESKKNMRAANDAARKMHIGAELKAIEAKNEKNYRAALCAASKKFSDQSDKLHGIRSGFYY